MIPMERPRPDLSNLTDQQVLDRLGQECRLQVAKHGPVGLVPDRKLGARLLSSPAAQEIITRLVGEKSEESIRKAIAVLELENGGARLGLATTGQLLSELRARIEVDYAAGGGGLDYTTVGGRPEVRMPPEPTEADLAAEMVG